MRWIATPAKDTTTGTLEKRPWGAADQFRANTGLKAQEYSGPILGLIYEYFLGDFARAEGHKGAEFYTPGSIVRLLTEIIEPFHGRILDPACGSGGIFVQSARFVAEHQKTPAAELAICGVELRRDELCSYCIRP